MSLLLLMASGARAADDASASGGDAAASDAPAAAAEDAGGVRARPGLYALLSVGKPDILSADDVTLGALRPQVELGRMSGSLRYGLSIDSAVYNAPSWELYAATGTPAPVLGDTRFTRIEARLGKGVALGPVELDLHGGLGAALSGTPIEAVAYEEIVLGDFDGVEPGTGISGKGASATAGVRFLPAPNEGRPRPFLGVDAGVMQFGSTWTLASVEVGVLLDGAHVRPSGGGTTGASAGSAAKAKGGAKPPTDPLLPSQVGAAFAVLDADNPFATAEYGVGFKRSGIDSIDSVAEKAARLKAVLVLTRFVIDRSGAGDGSMMPLALPLLRELAEIPNDAKALAQDIQKLIQDVPQEFKANPQLAMKLPKALGTLKEAATNCAEAIAQVPEVLAAAKAAFGGE